MTVKCLPKDKQLMICEAYQNPSQLNAMAEWWGVSRRTIIRVLEDHNVDPGIKRRNHKPKAVLTHQLTIREALEAPDTQFMSLEPNYSFDVNKAMANFEAAYAKKLEEKPMSWSSRALRAIANVLRRPFA